MIKETKIVTKHIWDFVSRNVFIGDNTVIANTKQEGIEPERRESIKVRLELKGRVNLVAEGELWIIRGAGNHNHSSTANTSTFPSSASSNGPVGSEARKKAEKNILEGPDSAGKRFLQRIKKL